MKAFYCYTLNVDGTMKMKVPVPLDEGRAGANMLAFMTWQGIGESIHLQSLESTATFNTYELMIAEGDSLAVGVIAFVLVGGNFYRRTIAGWEQVTTPDYVTPTNGDNGGGDNGGGNNNDNYFNAYGTVNDSWADGWKIWNPANAVAPAAITGSESTSTLVFPGRFTCTRIKVKPADNIEDMNGITIYGSNSQFPLVPNIVKTLTGNEVPDGEGWVTFDIAVPDPMSNATRQIDSLTVLADLAPSVEQYPILQVRVYSDSESPVTGVFPVKNITTKNQIYLYRLGVDNDFVPTFNTPDNIYVNTPGMNFPAGHFPNNGYHGDKVNFNFNINGDPAVSETYSTDMPDLFDLVTATYNPNDPGKGGIGPNDIIIKARLTKRVVDGAPDVYYAGFHTFDANNSRARGWGFTVEFTGRFAGMVVDKHAVDFYKSGQPLLDYNEDIISIQDGRGQLI